MKNMYLKPIQSRVGNISHLPIYSRLWFSHTHAHKKNFQKKNNGNFQILHHVALGDLKDQQS